jgi:hypothetical protein
MEIFRIDSRSLSTDSDSLVMIQKRPLTDKGSLTRRTCLTVPLFVVREEDLRYMLSPEFV